MICADDRHAAVMRDLAEHAFRTGAYTTLGRLVRGGFIANADVREEWRTVARIAPFWARVE